MSNHTAELNEVKGVWSHHTTDRYTYGFIKPFKTFLLLLDEKAG